MNHIPLDRYWTISATAKCGGEVSINIDESTELRPISPAMKEVVKQMTKLRPIVSFPSDHSDAETLKKYITSDRVPANHGYVMPPAWFIEARPTPFKPYVWIKDEHRLEVAISEAEKIKRNFRYYRVRVRAN